MSRQNRRSRETISYSETINKVADYYENPAVVSFAEDDELESNEETLPHGAMTFSEGDLRDLTLEDALEPFLSGEDSFEEIIETAEEAEEVAQKLVEDHGDQKLEDLLPGADVSLSDLNHDDEVQETDYINDKDLGKFMDYVSQMYPAKIPRHDGTSTVGCERAISFLDRMNGEISRAIRDDHENVLDIAKLEDVRLNIMRDVLVLKDHLTKLKRQIKDNHSKKSSDTSIPSWKNAAGKSISYAQLKAAKEADGLEKVAGTPNNVVIAVSPFERAISGMMINAHVSAGHPMEDVYASLKKKYDLTDREELSIMQLCMDSGFHIFKDRGSYSEESANDSGEKRGVDFVKNYFG